MRILKILFMLAFCLSTSQANAIVPEGGFENSALDRLFTEFEDICLPFIMHESEVSRHTDKEHFDDLMENKGYNTNTQQYVSGLVKEGVKTQRYNSKSYLKSETYVPNKNYPELLSARLYWEFESEESVQSKPGQRCQMQIQKNDINTSSILKKLQGDDPRWKEISRPNIYDMWIPNKGRMNTSKRGQFTVFNGVSDEVVESLDGMLGWEQKYYSICAKDYEGSIQITLRIGATERLGTMPNETEFITLVVNHKACDIPTE